MIYFIVMHLLKNDILIEYFTFVFNVDEGEITKHFHFFFQDKFRFSHTRWFYCQSAHLIGLFYNESPNDKLFLH